MSGRRAVPLCRNQIRGYTFPKDNASPSIGLVQPTLPIDVVSVYCFPIHVLFKKKN